MYVYVAHTYTSDFSYSSTTESEISELLCNLFLSLSTKYYNIIALLSALAYNFICKFIIFNISFQEE